MKKKSNGWTFVIFILSLVALAHDHATVGAVLMAWAYYRMGYKDGAKDGSRDVFVK